MMMRMMRMMKMLSIEQTERKRQRAGKRERPTLTQSVTRTRCWHPADADCHCRGHSARLPKTNGHTGGEDPV